MSQFLSEKNIRRLFFVSLVLKALNGFLEIVGGLILVFIGPATLNGIFLFFVAGELAEDPHDFLVNQLIPLFQNLSLGTIQFGAVYLLVHGLLKVFLSQALLRTKMWAYPLALVVFGLFVVYEIYRYTYTHSPLLIIFGLFDVLVLILIWHEYRYYLHAQKSSL